MDAPVSAAGIGGVERRGPASWVLRVLSGLWDRAWLRWSAVFMSLALLLLTGVVGLGRSGGLLGGGFDFDYFYYAGKLWLSGVSPYDFSAFSKWSAELFPFAYPPNASALSMGLGALPRGVALRIMQVLNLLALYGVIAGLSELSRDRREPAFKARLAALVALLVLSSPFSSHVMWMGQSSLLVMGTVIAAFVAADRQRWALAGVLCAVAMFKPQMALLAVLYLALKGNRVFLVSLVLASLALIVWPLWVSGGLSRFFAEYQASVAGYQASPYQALSFRHVFGLRSLLHSLGLPSPNLAPAILPLAALLVWKRRSISPVEVLAINSLAALLFLPSHDYDLVLLAPLIPIVYSMARQSPGVVLGAIAAALLLSFPQRILLEFGSQALIRYRELICLTGLAVVTFLVWRRRAPGSADPEQA